MNKKQRNNLIRIIIAAVLLIILHFAAFDRPIMFVCYMVPYLIVGYDILKKAGKGIVNRQPLDENLLMAIATIGAIALAVYKTGDFTEAVAVMLFYQVGELFQGYAVGKSRRNIGELMDIRPDYANIEEDGVITKVDPDDVEIGTVIIVQPGEKIPIDGIVVEGKASLDTSALTGESVPRAVKEDDEVISGCINTNGVLKIRTTREFDESTASKVLDLVENASSRKARSENFISRFARVYTPIVVICAVLLAIVPPVISMAALGMAPNWGTWIYRALTFLVISCPCALVISIPLSFFAGIGGASREGILVKGSNYLEALSKVKTVVMDKTGTLTRGVFEVTGIYPSPDSDLSEEEILHLAAHAERHSSHPIAQALRVAFGKEHDGCEVDDVEEIAGHGIRAKVDGKLVCIGNRKMVKLALSNGADDVVASGPDATDNAAADTAGTVIHVVVDGKYEGYIIISDVIKETSAEAIRKMREAGVTRQVMLTGDGKAAAEAVGSQLGITEIYSELLPADKVSKVEELLTPGKQSLAFVGDGINDAPVLSRADIGIAMGALGLDAAIEAADVVLMDDDPLKIAKAIRISRKCMRIVHENIWFAIGIKVLCLFLCAVGLVGMWAAIFADVGVMVLAVLNAIRTLFV
ncbi:MAG: heavy metal translocating P-type ATPase [Firmicutes bacterium]|nr:heavy metal translocating P-type ATPase [Bacillota bacterium]